MVIIVDIVYIVIIFSATSIIASTSLSPDQV